MDGTFLTEVELVARSGGEQTLVALAGGGSASSERIDQARLSAEDEAVSYLSVRYVMPTSPATSPSDLKDLVAQAVPYHLRRAVSPTDIPDQIRLAHLDVLNRYRDVVAKKANVAGLTERSDGRVSGAAVALPPEERRPIAAGEFDGFRPGSY